MENILLDKSKKNIKIVGREEIVISLSTDGR